MDRMIFINLPVADVDAARAFYTGLGFSLNDDYSDEQVACIVVSDQILVMLLERSRFAEFAPHDIADARQVTEVLNCLSAGSREEVDRYAERAVELGGTSLKTMTDGPMYGRSFTDLDGHVWELIHMDLAGAPA